MNEALPANKCKRCRLKTELGFLTCRRHRGYEIEERRLEGKQVELFERWQLDMPAGVKDRPTRTR